MKKIFTLVFVLAFMSLANAQDTMYIHQLGAGLIKISIDKIDSITFNIDEDTYVSDIDSNIYRTVMIGTQLWMVENLNTTHYNDGSAIQFVTDDSKWLNDTLGAYTYYNNDELTYKNFYGALYNGYAVQTDKLCLTGWHVPSETEWNTMIEYLSANGYNYDGTITYVLNENKLAKALAATYGWNYTLQIGHPGNSDYPLVRNKSGFTALPAGWRSLAGFDYSGIYAFWWSSSINSYNSEQARFYDIESITMNQEYIDLRAGLSVRCVKD